MLSREVSGIKSRDYAYPGTELWEEYLETRQTHESGVCQGMMCRGWIETERCGVTQEA